MDLLTKDLKLMSFKAIKEEFDKIDIIKEYKTDEYQKLIDVLVADGRKNVISLGERLSKNKDKIIKEIKRVRAMYDFDKGFGEYKYIAGVDEVGRGPLAGPIVACAVILDHDVIDDELILGLNDSKKLSEKKREELAEIIKKKSLYYHIAECTNEEIDTKGIAYANNKVFLDACMSMEMIPDLVLSDGYLVKNIQVPNKSVVKGDTKSACIAAASIVAKVYRDNLMKEYAKMYPQYDFEDNAGYGTSKHIEALKEVGLCPIHRASFLTRIL